MKPSSKQDQAERNANSLRQLKRLLKPGSRVYVHTALNGDGYFWVEVYVPVAYDNPFSVTGPDLSIAWLTAHVANVTNRRRNHGGTGEMIVIDDGGTEARTKIAEDLTRVLGFEVTAERL